MKQAVFAIFAFLCVLNLGMTAPQGDEEKIPLPHFSKAKILDQQQTMHDNGDYEFSIQREDGTYQEEYGRLKEVAGSPTFSVTGSYTYLDENGQTQTVNYEADEMGYRAKSTAVQQ